MDLVLVERLLADKLSKAPATKGWEGDVATVTRLFDAGADITPWIHG